MTKPWEETWEVFDTESKFPAFAAVLGKYERSVFESLSGEDEDIPRARLAAQAPAMARLLLRVHDLGNTLGGCPICKAITCPHAPDCELQAVLRAAGVLP